MSNEDRHPRKCIGMHKVCKGKGCEYRFPLKRRDIIECPQCQADRRCKKWANKGNTVCNSHGGGSPKVGRSGGRTKERLKNTTNKKIVYSKNKNIAETLESLRDDQDLLHLHEEVKVNTYIIGGILENLDSGTVSYLVDTLEEILKLSESTQKMPHITDDERNIRARTELKAFSEIRQMARNALNKGRRQKSSRAELAKHLDLQSRLTSAEIKNGAMSQYTVSAMELLDVTFFMIDLTRNIISSFVPQNYQMDATRLLDGRVSAQTGISINDFEVEANT